MGAAVINLLRRVGCASPISLTVASDNHDPAIGQDILANTAVVDDLPADVLQSCHSLRIFIEEQDAATGRREPAGRCEVGLTALHLHGAGQIGHVQPSQSHIEELDLVAVSSGLHNSGLRHADRTVQEDDDVLATGIERDHLIEQRSNFTRSHWDISLFVVTVAV